MNSRMFLTFFVIFCLQSAFTPHNGSCANDSEQGIQSFQSAIENRSELAANAAAFTVYEHNIYNDQNGPIIINILDETLSLRASEFKSIANAEASRGRVYIGLDTTFIYEPGPKFFGSDRIRYTVEDTNNQLFLFEIKVCSTQGQTPGTSIRGTDKSLKLLNYPNPFNPVTSISFRLNEKSSVSVTIFNQAGQIIFRKESENFQAGTHSLQFDGSGLASGFYFVTLKTAREMKTHKMLLLK